MVRSFFGLMVIASLFLSETTLADSCHEIILNPDKLLSRSEAIIGFGEIHGTEEISQVVRCAVNFYLQKGETVALAVEAPHNLFDEFRPGMDLWAADTKGKLIDETWFWGELDDGRSSEAMFDLFYNWDLALLKSNSLAIRPVDVIEASTAIERDKHMADNLIELSQSYDRVVFLAGNLHVSEISHDMQGQTLKPAFYAVNEMGIETYSVNFMYKSGTYWATTIAEDGQLVTGIQQVSPKNISAEFNILHEIDEGLGYDAIMVLEKVKASVPFRSTISH